MVENEFESAVQNGATLPAWGVRPIGAGPDRGGQGPARISQIAKAEGIRMPTASNALHQLEDRGMIERIREETDRRGVKVQLTPFGKSELERVGNERTAYLANMLAALPEEKLGDITKLANLINELSEAYDTEEALKAFEKASRHSNVQAILDGTLDNN